MKSRDTYLSIREEMRTERNLKCYAGYCWGRHSCAALCEVEKNDHFAGLLKTVLSFEGELSPFRAWVYFRHEHSDHTYVHGKDTFNPAWEEIKGATTLIAACMWGLVPYVEHILNELPDAELLTANSKKHDALMIACRFDQPECVTLVGVKATTSKLLTSSSINETLGKSLGIAAKDSNLRSMKTLVDHGADLS